MANAPHDRKLCKYGDPFCPCQDGDPCHYEGENPMTPPARQPDALDEFPTIRALADVSQTTVGYQKHDLVAEAVACWRELERLRDENARLTKELAFRTEQHCMADADYEEAEARVAELEAMLGITPRAEALIRAAREQDVAAIVAELDACKVDSDRLSWLDRDDIKIGFGVDMTGGPFVTILNRRSGKLISAMSNIRDAIDAARGKP